MAAPLKPIALGAGAFILAALSLPDAGRRVRSDARRKKPRHAGESNSQRVADAVAGDAIRHRERAAQLSEVDYVFSKTGTAEIATDPMPPNLTDTFIMLKPRDKWPDSGLDKAALIEKMEARLAQLPGNAYEFSQPIQLRFNELLAGVRGDIAVKVFGEDFDVMLKAANQIAGVLNTVKGASDVKVEQVVGLPILDIAVDKGAIARLGLSVAAVQDVIGAAIGGQRAGVVFEGDRRFPIVVRLQDNLREDAQALESIPVALPSAAGQDARRAAEAGGEILHPRRPEPDFAGKRPSPRRGHRQCARARHRVGCRRSARKDRDKGDPAARLLDCMGRAVRESRGGPRAFDDRRAGLLLPDLSAALLRARRARDALLVFTAVPLALSGGVAALWLRGMPMSVSAAVGFIALSGVAVLNGLVMRTYISQLIAGGMPERQAIFKGAMTRLRPS